MRKTNIESTSVIKLTLNMQGLLIYVYVIVLAIKPGIFYQVPGKPLIIHTNEQPKSTSFSVKWLAPERVNGHIMSYELRWQHDQITKTKVVSKYLNNPMQEQVTNLRKFPRNNERVHYVH